MFLTSDDRIINDGAGVQGGRGLGEVGELFGQSRFDPGLMRPYVNSRGVRVVTANTGRVRKNHDTGEWEPELKEIPVQRFMDKGVYSPVFNATTMRKSDWIHLDRAVVKATRQRLRAWSDLVNANSVGGFNAFAKMTHEYEAMSDPGEAVIDMDGLAEGRNTNPLFKLRSVPLPITHSDFFFSRRRIEVSRNGGSPLDTTMAEAAGRRVAELIEKTVIGLDGSVEYGTQSGSGYAAHDGLSKVYGYTNTPYRVTKTDLTAPTGSNPEAVKQDVIEMRETMYSNGYYGPFMLYHSTAYDAFLDDDYFRSGSTAIQRTLRERIESIDGIAGVRRLDYLTSGYQMILVQMTSEVAQAINGMDITTVQWESQGGARVNFKVMAIQVPLIKAPYNGVGGIVHGTTS